jgi:hypothetical protein
MDAGRHQSRPIGANGVSGRSLATSGSDGRGSTATSPAGRLPTPSAWGSPRAAAGSGRSGKNRSRSSHGSENLEGTSVRSSVDGIPTCGRSSGAVRSRLVLCPRHASWSACGRIRPSRGCRRSSTAWRTSIGSAPSPSACSLIICARKGRVSPRTADHLEPVTPRENSRRTAERARSGAAAWLATREA